MVAVVDNVLFAVFPFLYTEKQAFGRSHFLLACSLCWRVTQSGRRLVAGSLGFFSSFYYFSFLVFGVCRKVVLLCIINYDLSPLRRSSQLILCIFCFICNVIFFYFLAPCKLGFYIRIFFSFPFFFLLMMMNNSAQL